MYTSSCNNVLCLLIFFMPRKLKKVDSIPPQRFSACNLVTPPGITKFHYGGEVMSRPPGPHATKRGTNEGRQPLPRIKHNCLLQNLTFLSICLFYCPLKNIYVFL